MKNLRVFSFIVLSVFMLFSCDEEPTEISDPYEQFVGNWLSTRVEFNTCDDPDNNDNYPDGLCNGVACFEATFNADQTYEFTDNTIQPAQTFNGTVTLADNTFTLCSGGFCNTFNYSFSENGTVFNVTGDVPVNPPDCQLDFDLAKN